jgi:hypothetical protein
VDERLAGLSRVLREHLESVPFVCSPSAVVEQLDQVQVIAQQVAALQLALIRHADALGIPAAQGATSTAAWLADRYRVLPGGARRQVKLAAALDQDCPATMEAMAEGRVNLERARDRESGRRPAGRVPGTGGQVPGRSGGRVRSAAADRPG